MTTETGKDRTNERSIPDSVLEELMAGYEKPEDLPGDEGLFRELKRRLIEKAPGAALTDSDCGLVATGPSSRSIPKGMAAPRTVTGKAAEKLKPFDTRPIATVKPKTK